jgi:hypothetical protein
VSLVAVAAGEVCCSPSVCANVVCIMGELLIRTVDKISKTNSPNAAKPSFLILKLDIGFNLFSTRYL